MNWILLNNSVLLLTPTPSFLWSWWWEQWGPRDPALTHWKSGAPSWGTGLLPNTCQGDSMWARPLPEQVKVRQTAYSRKSEKWAVQSITCTPETLQPGSRMRWEHGGACTPLAETRTARWAGHLWGDEPPGPGPARCQACPALPSQSPQISMELPRAGGCQVHQITVRLQWGSQEALGQFFCYLVCWKVWI